MKLDTSFGNSGLISRLREIGILLFALTLTACASFDGRALQPGVAKIDDVVSVMGQPAMRWLDADGGEQLVFPRGPAGTQTFMAFFGPDERLLRLEKVLEPRQFARIIPGQHDQADILRLLGPSNPAWTIYFKARDELAWEWLFCDDWSRLARFGVLFDATSGLVRSTYQQPEPSGPRGVAPFCGH